MELKYIWAMRSKWTFRIRPIKKWILSHIKGETDNWADPFCGKSEIAGIRNDLRNGMDAHDFFTNIKDCSLDGVLFDPPYSMEQVKRTYQGAGIKDWQNLGNKSAAFPIVRKEIARCLKIGGICLSFGWSSAGIGKKYGMKKISLLVVCHGQGTNDTLCLAEKKMYHQPELPFLIKKPRRGCPYLRRGTKEQQYLSYRPWAVSQVSTNP
jgi:hypothetical protein